MRLLGDRVPDRGGVRGERLIVGAEAGFDAFYAQEYRGVVGLALALSGNRWAAEDLAQEAFLAAHRSWDRVGAYPRPDLWVRRVVANLAVSAFRRRMAEARALGRVAFGRTPPLPELSADDAEFWQAVRSLPRRQAQVVALHYFEDRPVADIADILDVAVGTVKKHLFDGRRALAERLGVDDDPDKEVS
jgi:RNA polymerase sigma-70 factor (ECF subfamily)